MNCPECKKPLNPSLSACSSCGLIVDEDVRNELGIYRLFPENIPTVLQKPTSSQPSNDQGNFAMSQANYNQPIGKSYTSDITSKETSPTLVEFPNKNADLPEWRLKLQEAVKTRKDNQIASLPKPIVTKRRTVATRGANALAVDVYERAEPRTSSNPLLDLAMQRIEKSRKKYALLESAKIFEQKIQQPVVVPIKPKPLQIVYGKTESLEQQKPLPDANSFNNFNDLTTQTANKVPRMIKVEENDLVNQANTPLSMQPKIERIKTNKLPALIPARVSSSLGKVFSNGEIIEEVLIKNEVKLEETPNYAETIENDDIPPFAMRLNSALFDLIIGAFLSVILLSPLVLIGKNLFTMDGFFGFLGVFSVVMFAYLTISIGMLGKTLGMRLFSLEVINASDSDFPSYTQSAISSSVYLLSLALGGIGFLAMFFNDDRRAAHDLLSGTIVVREL
jgi:uncharacterized RDD family membrane protein YckC